MNEYPNLFQPLKVGSIYLRNRIMSAPRGNLRRMSTAYWLEHLAEISRGGAALITLGSIGVDKNESLIVPHGMYLQPPHLAQIAEELSAIHQYGAKASIELIHCGMWAVSGDPNYPPVGPNDRLRDEGKDADNAKVHGLTVLEMEVIAQKFATSALTAKQLGFDMVMLHFAHGWLPAQFLSPYFNKRTDEFGGNFENRIRFPIMIVERVRQAVGPDFPIEMRISGEEYLKGGWHIDECIAFVKRIEDKIDMIQVSAGVDKYFETTTRMITCALSPQMPNVNLSRAMKEQVNIPVSTVGGILNPEDMESILVSGKADAVTIGRALVADPELPEKARTGRREDIVPCLRCVSCYHVATKHLSLGCAVNPSFGRESRIKADIRRADIGKTVVVIGGGVAGMKAAITAADNGHRVLLLEKKPYLGGILQFTEYDRSKEEVARYKEYLITQVNKRKAIEVRLNIEATREMVESLNPDFLVVAVGSAPAMPKIPGLDGADVLDILTAYERIALLPKRVTVIGGGQSGAEFALSLAKRGHSVSIIEMQDRLAKEGNLSYQTCLDQMIPDYQNITVLLDTVCKRVEGTNVVAESMDGTMRIVEGDVVINAAGMRARRELAASFVGAVYDVRMIGDCVSARRLNEATFDGFFAVSNV